jgi:hypothetical protein
MTMREIPSPSWRERENPPPLFVVAPDGGGAGGGVMEGFGVSGALAAVTAMGFLVLARSKSMTIRYGL